MRYGLAVGVAILVSLGVVCALSVLRPMAFVVSILAFAIIFVALDLSLSTKKNPEGAAAQPKFVRPMAASLEEDDQSDDGDNDVNDVNDVNDDDAAGENDDGNNEQHDDENAESNDAESENNDTGNASKKQNKDPEQVTAQPAVKIAPKGFVSRIETIDPHRFSAPGLQVNDKMSRNKSRANAKKTREETKKLRDFKVSQAQTTIAARFNDPKDRLR